MRKALAVLALVALSGCATPPQWLARVYDTNDPCQSRPELGRPVGYQIPNWCGAGAGSLTITNTTGYPIGYIRKSY